MGQRPGQKLEPGVRAQSHGVKDPSKERFMVAPPKLRPPDARAQCLDVVTPRSTTHSVTPEDSWEAMKQQSPAETKKIQQETVVTMPTTVHDELDVVDEFEHRDVPPDHLRHVLSSGETF